MFRPGHAPAADDRSVPGQAQAVRVLHVIPWLAPRYGGSAAAALEMARAVSTLGHRVEAVATNLDGPGILSGVEVGRAVAWEGLRVTFHQSSRPRRFVASRAMAADLLRRVAEFDVAHIHTLYRFPTLAAALACRARGVPYVIQPHGALDPWHRAQRRRAKDLYHHLILDSVIDRAAAIVCTSAQEAEAIRGLGYRAPIWVVPLGVEAATLRAPAEDGELPAVASDPGMRVITFLGRISAKKGVELLVDAFAHVALARADAVLVVAGPDDEGIADGLRSAIADGGLSHRVSFPGTTVGSEKRALLQRSDVFVLPSADESFGLSVAEAMAVACPVVVTPHVALAETVRSYGAGVVVERESRDIAAGVLAILADAGMAESMGAAGARAVDERLTWPRIATVLETMYRAVAGRGATRRSPTTAPSSTPSFTLAALDGVLVCPTCRQSLSRSAETFSCVRCPRSFRSDDGIPVLLPDPSLADHDEIDHAHGQGHDGPTDPHKAAQGSHFDRAVSEEFETSRPRGTPRLYRFLLAEKFRRATQPIRPHLVGARVLTVCGGSGMDAEFLARAGAHVVATDLSLGAARRTRERARRYGLDITPLVADVEQLPFSDRSFDLVLVHDGLHHLQHPELGLAEMGRVADRWVSVTEPARAAVTSAAIAAGLALDREEAGNVVARLRPGDVVSLLRGFGFQPVVAERYAMYYRHEPGTVFRLLSRRPWFPLVRTAWRAGNAVLGRIGNKLVVVAERHEVGGLAESAALEPTEPAARRPEAEDRRT